MNPARSDQLLPVVVALSADGFDAGLRFGAAEAVREGRPLHLVHVVGHAPAPTTAAEQLCSRAVERAAGLVGHQVRLSSEVLRGELIEELVELSHNARLVVLQRHAVGVARTDPRATSAKLASRAVAPVVCVPRDWNDRGTGTVTVGVDDVLSCVPLLREALVAAGSRGAQLQILHVDLPHRESDSELEIKRALAEASVDLQAVAVTIEVIEADTPVAALVAAMETSELLVIGRHHPLVARGSRLGPVGRRLIRDASCPVLLLTPSASTSSADWVFGGYLA